MQLGMIMQKSKKIMVKVARGALELMLSVIVVIVFAVTIYNYPGYMRMLQMGGNKSVDAKVGLINNGTMTFSDEGEPRKLEVELTTEDNSMMVGPMQLEFESNKDSVESEEIFLQPIIPESARDQSAQKNDMDPMIYALEFTDEDMKSLERDVEISMESAMQGSSSDTQPDTNEGIVEIDDFVKKDISI
jgi:hypothetical protein